MESKRVLGEALAISVGTAAALEVILQKEHLDKEYDHLYLNLATLYRNFHDAYPKQEMPGVGRLISEFIDELKVIHGIVSESISHKIQPVIYIATLKSLGSLFPHAVLWRPKTQLQKTKAELEKAVINGALGKLPEEWFTVFDVAIKGNNAAALIITHQPVHLLSAPSFRKLVLVDSYTGTFRPKTQWIQKLTKNPDYVNLPFNPLTLQLLGDGGVNFLQPNRSAVKEIVELAKAKYWTANTTLLKITYDLTKLADKSLAQLLNKMCHVTLR